MSQVDPETIRPKERYVIRRKLHAVGTTFETRSTVVTVNGRRGLRVKASRKGDYTPEFIALDEIDSIERAP